MKLLPRRATVPVKPKQYLKQGFSHCGAYATKAILSAFGKDNKDHPKEYFRGPIGKLTGITMSPQFWVNVMKQYSIQSQIKHARSADITLLQKILASGKPVMITIANGYLPDGSYSSLKAQLISHWITLWGYDDNRGVFYVYDPCVPRDRYVKNIPIGNTTRTYAQMQQDWKGAWFRNLFGWRPYMYLAIQSK